MEEFGILGLEDDRQHERVKKEPDTQKEIRNQKGSKNLEFLISGIYERLVSLTNVSLRKHEIQGHPHTHLLGKVSIFEKMTNQLILLKNLANEEGESEVSDFITTLAEIIIIILAHGTTENNYMCLRTDKVFSELLIQFLETISDIIQIANNSTSTSKPVINIKVEDELIYSRFTTALIVFARHPKKLKIIEPIFQSILSTLRLLWIFLKFRSEMCTNILKNILESETFNFNVIDSSDKEFWAMLRILLEMFRDSDYEPYFSQKLLNWIKNINVSENVITLLTIFIEYSKPHKIIQILNCSELISYVRIGLLSNSPIERKESLFVLKSLTSTLLVLPGNEDAKRNTVTSVFNINTPNVIKLWADFFDLFEILDEKQIHIIKPVLPKLKTFKIFVSNSDLSIFYWYFVLLKKMFQHDNRFVAREGLINYLEAVNFIPSNSENEELKKIFTEFLNFTLLPVLRESIGWILPEAQDFFKISKKFGFVLTQILDNNFLLISNAIMSFINKFDIGLSPPAVFFFNLGIFYGISELPKPNGSATDFGQVLSSFTQFLLKGISALDKFLRLETQKLLVYIFCKLIKLFEIDYFDIDSSPALEILSFLGALDNFIISSTESFDDFQKDLMKVEMNVLKMFSLIESLNSLQILGLYRLSFLKGTPWILLESDSMTWTSEEIQNKVKNAHLDFLKSLTLCTDKNKDAILVSQMRLALHFWKSEQDLDSTRNHFMNQSHFISYSNFDLCQQILELVAENSAISDIGNELLGIMSHSSQVLDSQFCHLGENMQNDYDVLRFIEVFAKFLFLHVESSLIQFPAIFMLENFSDLFFRTDFTNYEDTNDYFRSEVIGKRLAAFSKILQLNYKINMKSHVEILNVIDQNILKSVLDQVDLAGPQGVIHVLEFIGISLSFISYNDIIHEMIDDFLIISWNRVFEMRKTDSFWIGIREFVKLIIHPYFTGRGALEKYSREIFIKSDTITGISLVLLESLVDIVSSPIESDTRRNEIIQVCLEAIWFGPPLLKHIKVTYGLWEYVQQERLGRQNCTSEEGPDIIANVLGCSSKFNEDSYNFVFNANAKTRLLGIRWIMDIIDTSISSDEILDFVVQQLLENNDFESDKKRRYFGNSSTHRIKQRISQALLAFQPMFNQEISKTVTCSLMLSLTRDSPQPSVRYLMEWVIIRCLVKYPENHDTFFQTAEECYRKRVGFGSFLSTICSHACNILTNVEVLTDFSEKSLRSLSKLLMGQHFTVRLYARICFRRIYEKVVSFVQPQPPMLNKFEILYENVCAENPQPAGNISKISQNIESDFYAELFNAEDHYLYEVVFIYLPKIAGVAADELIQERDLLGVFQTSNSKSSGNSKSGRLTFDCDNRFRHLYTENKQFAWHLKAVSDDGREMGEEATSLFQDVLLENTNFQKKMNPWKFLSVAPEISDFPEKLQLRKNSSVDGLVVVASLVDRVPNLGGLCRTCEIFGVSRYVISGLKSMEEQQFQNLSVSAQRWIDILEVPVKDLDVFLRIYAQKGYTILGVEQALESVPLNQYNFPKKSVLLLGNEKYGIPPHLLHLVNQCLEIPQVGVIRSLNVHVTGALCIWQYAMQHIV